MAERLIDRPPRASVAMLSSLPEDTKDVFVRVGGNKPPLAIAVLPTQQRTSFRRLRVERPHEDIRNAASQYANETWSEGCECEIWDMDDPDPQADCTCHSWDNCYNYYMEEQQWEDFPEQDDENSDEADEGTAYHLRNPMIVWGGDPCTGRSPFRYLMSVDGLYNDTNVVAPGTPNMYRGGDACLGGNAAPYSHLEAWEAYWNSYHNADLNQPVNIPPVLHPELARVLGDAPDPRAQHKAAALLVLAVGPDDTMKQTLVRYLNNSLPVAWLTRLDSATQTGILPLSWDYDDEDEYGWCQLLPHISFARNTTPYPRSTPEQVLQLARVNNMYVRARSARIRAQQAVAPTKNPLNDPKVIVLERLQAAWERRYHEANYPSSRIYSSVADMRQVLMNIARATALNAAPEQLWAKLGLSNDMPLNENNVLGLGCMSRLFGSHYEPDYYRSMDGYYDMPPEHRRLANLSKIRKRWRASLSNKAGALDTTKLIDRFLRNILPEARRVLEGQHPAPLYAFSQWFQQLVRAHRLQPRWSTVWRHLRDWRWGSPINDPRVNTVRRDYPALHCFAGHRPYPADWNFEELTHIEPSANLCLLGLRTEDPISDMLPVVDHLKLWHFGSGMLRGLMEAGAEPDDVAQFYDVPRRSDALHQRSVFDEAQGLGTVLPCLRQGDTLFTQLGNRVYRGTIIHNGHIPPAPRDVVPTGYDVVARRTPIVIIWGDVTPTE
jgi:hypothetical protein